MVTAVNDGRPPAPVPDRTRAFVAVSVAAVLVYWLWLFGVRTPPASGPSTGVVACDEYLAIMARCLVNMPVDARAAHAELVRTTRANLTHAAARPEEIPRVTAVCIEMRETVRRNPLCK